MVARERAHDAANRTRLSGQRPLPRIEPGNNRACVFHQDGDFQAFVDLLSEAKLRHPMRILAYSVMPNHFHLALGPLEVILSGGNIDLEFFFRSLEAAWL